MIGIFSHGILRIPHLDSFIGKPYRRQWKYTSATGLTAVAGWGLKQTTNRARAFGYKHNLPYLALEDGFLRSVGLGVAGYAPCSMIVDEQGIYYDYAWPSRLETLITNEQMDPDLLAQAGDAIALIRKHRLSKYNHAPSDVDLGLPAGRRVLVVDQTTGDLSVLHGRGDEDAFARMLKAAIDDNPDATVLVKTHPDVLSGKKTGYLSGLPDMERVVCITQDCNPMQLLEQVDKVYVVTSHMGFEALIQGKPVVCFGLPWYSCWGLTEERNPKRGQLQHRRYKDRTIEHLFAAAYIQYTRYIDPDTGAPGTLFDVIRHLIDGKRRNDESRGTLFCVAMSPWKRAIVKPFLQTPSSKVVFVKSAEHLHNRRDQTGRMVIWGRKDADSPATYDMPGMPVLRMEDGFLRSVGLGSNLRRPLSLVVDGDGIYYDAGMPSALEKWLKSEQLLTMELDRAASLRKRLVALKLSKYNVGAAYAPGPQAEGKRILLVVGQVEGDASLRYGSPEIQTNAALMARVRADNPDAYIIYKPHPDVVAGNRKGALARVGVVAPGADTPWNELAIHANIIDCILCADEIHTMTSQAGFEALMHGKPVHCYGRPFYSGWGRTFDHAAKSWRGAYISLDKLVFGVLIHYPRYIDPISLKQVSVEHVVNLLESARAKAGKSLIKTGYVARQCHKAIEIWRTLR